LRSHDGDWRQGKADEFGWDAMNPLVAVDARGKNQGTLPPASSLVAVDQPNVACTTLKPAEANGAGFIVRLVETQGRPTAATVSLPLLAPLVSATAVNLVEDDRSEPLAIADGGRIAVKLPPFGVKTIRVAGGSSVPPGVTGLAARAVSDMEVALSWDPAAKATLSHYHVYRSTKPGFVPGLLYLVERPAHASCVDRPQLHYGGWINNRLEPGTTYYYRVAAVDRWNREGPASPAVAAVTMKSSEKNMTPLEVERLSAVLVSPISRYSAVNLLWRTNCEPDIRSYEVHRSTVSGFEPGSATRIGAVDAQSILKGGGAYGQTPIDYRLGDFDHQMYLDTAVEPTTTYYYRVCAVDATGQKGPFSQEVQATTKTLDPLTTLAMGITAQSVYAPQYGVELAIDGSTDPYFAWISKPYGGGTKEKPQDVWWTFEFPTGKKLALSGVKIVGDHREVIPLQKNLQVQARVQGEWKTVGRTSGATAKDLVIRWPRPVATDAIRVFVPAADLPQSTRADVDGVVRICELLFVLPDGREVAPIAALGP